MIFNNYVKLNDPLIICLKRFFIYLVFAFVLNLFVFVFFIIIITIDYFNLTIDFYVYLNNKINTFRIRKGISIKKK